MFLMNRLELTLKRLFLLIWIFTQSMSSSLDVYCHFLLDGISMTDRVKGHRSSVSGHACLQRHLSTLGGAPCHWITGQQTRVASDWPRLLERRCLYGHNLYLQGILWTSVLHAPLLIAFMHFPRRLSDRHLCQVIVNLFHTLDCRAWFDASATL